MMQGRNPKQPKPQGKAKGSFKAPHIACRKQGKLRDWLPYDAQACPLPLPFVCVKVSGLCFLLFSSSKSFGLNLNLNFF